MRFALALPTASTSTGSFQMQRWRIAEGLGTPGRSIWPEYVRRNRVASGGFLRPIDEDGLRGLTSNPSIPEKAIADSPGYTTDASRATVRVIRTDEDLMIARPVRRVLETGAVNGKD